MSKKNKKGGKTHQNLINDLVKRATCWYYLGTPEMMHILVAMMTFSKSWSKNAFTPSEILHNRTIVDKRY